MIKIFISYRREDSIYICDRIYAVLAQQFGQENIFRDISSMRPGTNFRKRLEEQENPELGAYRIRLSLGIPASNGEQKKRTSIVLRVDGVENRPRARGMRCIPHPPVQTGSRVSVSSL